MQPFNTRQLLYYIYFFYRNFYTFIEYSYWYNGLVDNTPLESAISLSRHSIYGATGYKFNIKNEKSIYLSLFSDAHIDKAGIYNFFKSSTGFSIAYKDTNMIFSLYMRGESYDEFFGFNDFYVAINSYYNVFMFTLTSELGYHTYYDFDASLGFTVPVAKFADAFLKIRYFFSLPTEYEILGGFKFNILDFIEIDTIVRFYQIKGFEYNIGFNIPIDNYIKKYAKNKK